MADEIQEHDDDNKKKTQELDHLTDNGEELRRDIASLAEEIQVQTQRQESRTRTIATAAGAGLILAIKVARLIFKSA